MYPNLRAELARRGLTLEDVGLCIGKTVNTVSCKMRGVVPFTVNEARKIQKDVLETDLSIDFLFAEAD